MSPCAPRARPDQVERAFRSLKSVDFEVRPIHHRRAGRVRAHVFLCMLADHVIWHLRQALAPLLLDDHDRAAAAAGRASPVAAAEVPPAAAKARTKRTAEDRPVHSWRSLLRDLATLTRNTVRLGDAPPITLLTRPTPLQQDVFRRLGLALEADPPLHTDSFARPFSYLRLDERGSSG